MKKNTAQQKKIKKKYEKNNDMIMELDIEDWEYFKDKPDEIMKQKKNTQLYFKLGVKLLLFFHPYKVYCYH